jgi:hypothetical protein
MYSPARRAAIADPRCCLVEQPGSPYLRFVPRLVLRCSFEMFGLACQFYRCGELLTPFTITTTVIWPRPCTCHGIRKSICCGDTK